MRKQEDFPYATGELSQLLRDIALAAKIVNREINRSGLIDITGAIGQQNVQGEEQQRLDVVANIRFIRALRNGGEVCTIISEEEDDMIQTGNPMGKYIVAIDPLDGSSNIDVNVSIGTIFSVYRRLSPIGGDGKRERLPAERYPSGGRRLRDLRLVHDAGLHHRRGRERLHLRGFAGRVFSSATPISSRPATVPSIPATRVTCCSIRRACARTSTIASSRITQPVTSVRW